MTSASCPCLQASEGELNLTHTSDSFGEDLALGSLSDESGRDDGPVEVGGEAEAEVLRVQSNDPEESRSLAAGPAQDVTGPVSHGSGPPPMPSSASSDMPEGPSLPSASGIVRVVNPDTFTWGPHFRLTFSDKSSKPPHGQWQATCNYHKLNERTGCKRSLSLGKAGHSKDLCKRVLMQWCLAAPLCTTKKEHSAQPLNVDDALDAALLEARLRTLPPPPARIRTDEEIEMDQDSEGGDPTSKKKRSIKPKAAKSKAKTKAKAKLQKTAAKQSEAAASSQKTSGSSSSSSSTSTSSSSSD